MRIDPFGREADIGGINRRVGTGGGFDFLRLVLQRNCSCYP